MVLEGKRIILRPFKKEDAKEYFKISNEQEVRKYLPLASPQSLTECEELIEYYCTYDFINDFYFVIEEKNTHKIIGAIICFRTLSFSLDLSYFIGNSFRGKEYVIEALNVFLDYLSKNTNYRVLIFTIHNNNKASQKVMKKINASKYQINTLDNTSSYEYRIKSAK